MKANKFLEKNNIDFELIDQDKPTKDCDEAAKQRGVETSQIVKSLVIEQEADYYHICIPGDRELSEKHFNNLRMVDPETSKDITGQESGTVHPFASRLKHFFDERIFEMEKVSFTTGNAEKAVIIDSTDLEEALEKADFEYQVDDLVVVNSDELEELEQKGLDEEKARFVAENGYRSLFNDLADENDNKIVLKLLMESDRQDLELNEENSREILEAADNETHLQKLIEHYTENGELPEENEFSIGEVVEQVVEGNPEAVDDYQRGEDSALNYLLGQVMQLTNGKADGGEARKRLLDALN